MTEKIPGIEKPKRKVDFLIGGEKKSFDRDAFMEDMGVVDIVRMQGTDFPNINATPGSMFDHFNIEKTVNRPPDREKGELERKYLIAKIVAPGQPEPLLTLDDALIVECEKSIPKLTYDQLTADHFAHALPGTNDALSLQDTMTKRYGGSDGSRGLSRDEVIAKGLGYTQFRIVGPAPESKIAR